MMTALSPFLNPTYIIAILIAVSFHECAHAFVAHRLGDPTARENGRLTLNPIAHLDLVGAILFLTVGFGWAKPVPVNSSYFRKPKRDLSLVALAGPVSNLILAFIAFLILFFVTHGNSLSAEGLLQHPDNSNIGLAVLLQILQSSIFVNLALMAFNLIPLAPLDGSNILRAFIPYQFEQRYEEFSRISPFILLALVILPNSFLSTWIYTIIGWVLAGFFGVVGWM